MVDAILMAALLDSLEDPFVFADTQHTIVYMNKAAVERFADRGGENLIGRSLLECHNTQSQQTIIETLAMMEAGTEERLITDSEQHRAYMRAVRSPEGQLLGYYERYDPPAK